MARFSNRFALALAVAMVLPEMFPVGALGRAAAQVAVPEPKRPADDDAAIPDSIAPAPAVLQAVTAGWMSDDERKDFRVLHGIFDDLDLDTPLRRALVALERWRLDDPALDDASVPRHLKAERWLRVGAHARVLEINGLYRHGFMIAPAMLDVTLEVLNTGQSPLSQRFDLALDLAPASAPAASAAIA